MDRNTNTKQNRGGKTVVSARKTDTEQADAREAKKTARLSALGLLLALAVILGYVEVVLPVSVGIPGIKLGLANCAILYVLYRYGFREALLISILRTVIIAFLFTNLAALLYSISGAVVSLILMYLLKKCRKKKEDEAPGTEKPDADRNEKGIPVFSIYGVSAFGGAAHNAAQFIVAYLILGTPQILGVWGTTYLPLLVLAGLAAGMINALLAALLLRRV